jgi:hypothetical protein
MNEEAVRGPRCDRRTHDDDDDWTAFSMLQGKDGDARLS